MSKQLDNSEKKICPKCGKPGSGPHSRYVLNSRKHRYQLYAYFAHRINGVLKWCYLGRIHKQLSNLKLSNAKETRCPECGGLPLQTQDGTGEIVCSTCGLVTTVQPRPTHDPKDYESHEMVHSLFPNRNLGSDPHQLLPALRKAGVVNRLGLRHLEKKDPPGFLPAAVILSRLCQQASVPIDESERLARRLRRKLRLRYEPKSSEELSAVVDELWKEYTSSRRGRVVSSANAKLTTCTLKQKQG